MKNIQTFGFGLIVLCTLPSLGTAQTATAKLVSIEYASPTATIFDGALFVPGTKIKILLTHLDGEWRALDGEASQLTVFSDERNTALGQPASADNGGRPAGFQADECRISKDGKSALLTLWGAGLPASNADELILIGTAAFFVGSTAETLIDRPDIRLSGGETFNVQPFRVVTSRGENGALDIELRYLKSEAQVTAVSMTTPTGVLPDSAADTLTSAGEEWVYKSSFVPPVKPGTATLLVRFLPIDTIESFPFEIRSGLSFGKPSTNRFVRWIKKFL